ncbi:hypothetical protein QWY75_10825 [Pontixanthobacter aestiaquae]|uniref:Uncharacterized protein n=1 Tax=Pontixanthobacter aestiaquae TaxID=1509367 RepID=A0A844Z497_9SPHN|nr:hypothetical protein [Pontixanthobacter aestiaquae]MDN3646693.1 hypothetical protein [Pontixanthobacter aestiaquae]MXO82324.1 hypothetical protein [Pontixanthobacter aestiaquae]
MLVNEVRAEISGHQVRVANYVNSAKLYIDGDCRDTFEELFSLGREPSLSASISDTPRPTLVEVFLKTGLLKVKIKICANGQFVAGDNF